MIRGTVLWIVWLERNKLYFQQSVQKPIRVVGIQIVSTLNF
jgi:hypothetical protein